MKVLTDGGLQIYDQNVKKIISDKLANTDGIINITDTTLYNSYAGGLVINNIKGKTEQNAYTGKNLFHMGQSDYAQNGITVTFDTENQSFSVTGTSTAISKINLTQNLEELKEKFVTGCTFVLSLVNATYNNPNFDVNISYEYEGTTRWIVPNDKPVTVPSGSTLYDFILYVKQGITLNASNVKIQLEESNVATEWEPYVGGKPSPSPSYPQEIKSVKGKNLLDCRGLTEQTINGVKFTPVYDENGNLLYVNVNGTASANSFYDMKTYETLSKGKYILNGCPSGGGKTTYQLDCFEPDKAALIDTGNGVDITLFDDTMFAMLARIVIRSGYTANNLKFYPMIRPASIKDDTYVPYGLLRIKTHNANLVDMSNPVSITNMSYNDDKKTYVQTATDTSTGFLLYIRQLKAYNDTNDYKWVYDGNITTAQTISCTFTKLSGYNAISIKHNGQAKDVGVFLNISHLKDGVTYYFKMNIVNATQGSIEFGEIIISETESNYVPYQSSEITLSKPIELNGLNGVYDVVTSDGVTRRFAEVVFDGSEDENITLEQVHNGKSIFTLYVEKETLGKNNGGTHLRCSCASRADVYSLVNKVDYTGSNSHFIRISLDNSIYTDVETFKTKLSENPMTIVYELATPTTEELPTADIIALKSLKTFDGTTYVEVDCEGNPIIDMDYGCSKVGATALQNKNDIQIENNQNSFSNINVQMTASSTNIHSIPATNKSDTIKLSGGDNITLHPDVANKKVTVSHNESGVAAGTYNQVTVDKFGHVTNGNNLTYVHEAVGVAGTDGLVKIARLTITKGYVDTPIIIEINQRGKSSSTIIYIKFVNSSNNDSTSASIKYMGVWTETYIVKADASIWDIYVKKTEAWDAITVLRYHNKLNGVSIEWTNELVTSVPSGAIQASECGSVERAMKLSNTNSIGSATQPVYFNASGVPVATTHRLETSVPSDAKFTDTTYGIVSSSTDGLCPKITNTKTKFLRDDGTWSIIENTNESKKQTEPTGQNIGDYWLLDY